MNSHCLDTICTYFNEYTDVLCFKKGSMSKLWMSYIDLVKLMLDLIRVSREGNWQFHLAAVKDMIPLC